VVDRHDPLITSEVPMWNRAIAEWAADHTAASAQLCRRCGWSAV